VTRHDIAAGEKDYVITDSLVLPVDVEVQAVQPHAHYRAREVKGVATLPDGTTNIMHSLMGGIKGTRRPDRPQRGIKSESQPTESNLTSANGQGLDRGRRQPSPKAPKSSRTNREIWLTPALCKIAAATQERRRSI